MAFGSRVLELLEEKNITQKEFAAMLNIAPTTLNGYIKNNRQPDFELVKQIAAELEVSIDYLFEYDNSRNELIPTPKEKQLLLQLRSLDDNQMKIIYDLIQLTYNNNQN